MKKLFQFELFKLRKQKSLYICSGLILVIVLFTLLVNLLLFKTLGAVYMEKPTAINVMLSAVSASDFTLIAGIFIVLYVCGDFNQQTIKNIYSRGFSRTEVYFVKLIVCVAYTVATFIITELFALATGSAFFGFAPQEGHIFALLLGQLLACIAYSSFVFAVCHLVKKTGVAIVVVIFVPMVLGLILMVLDAIIKADSFKLVDYWLDGMITKLSYTGASVTTIVVGCILPVVYAALFAVGGFFINRKSEV